MLEENPKDYGGFVLLFYGNEAFGDGIQGLEQAGMRLTRVRRSLWRHVDRGQWELPLPEEKSHVDHGNT